MDNIMAALRIPPETYAEARRFVTIYLAAGFFVSSIGAGSNLLRFDGYLKRLIAISCIAPFSSLAISYLLIRYAGLGFSAVAIGKCIGYFLTGALMLWLMAVKTKVVGFAKAAPSEIFAIFKNIARNGASNTVGDICVIFATMAINTLLITSFGKIEVSAFNAFNSLSGVFGAFSFGSALAVAQIAGVMIAERDSTSVKQAIRISLLYGLISIAVVGVLIIVFYGQIASLFGMGEGQALEVMRAMSVALAVSLVFDTIVFAFYFVFKAGEKNVLTTVIIVLRRVVFLLPPIFILTGLYVSAGLWHALWICPALCILAIVIYSLIKSSKNKHLTKVFLVDTEAEVNGTYASFSTNGSVSDITDCSRNISGFCERNNLDKTRSHQLALSIEEMLLLIREHSHKGLDAPMNVRILLQKGDVIMRVRNSGDMFNPIAFYKNLGLSRSLTLDEAEHHKDFLGLKMVVDSVKHVDYHETFGINNSTITI
jgi:Na+-driven multidrug efflux pump/anti-sigma regulatory factor (Ser/Thr protein kinase)